MTLQERKRDREARRTEAMIARCALHQMDPETRLCFFEVVPRRSDQEPYPGSNREGELTPGEGC